MVRPARQTESERAVRLDKLRLRGLVPAGPVVAAPPARRIIPQAPYIPNAPETLPDAPEAAAPAAKAKPAPAGKGGGFKEHLHIRGSDGKFLTRGGAVNVVQPDGSVRRGKVLSLTPAGPEIAYEDSGPDEVIPLADVTSRVKAAPKPIARVKPPAEPKPPRPVRQPAAPRPRAAAKPKPPPKPKPKPKPKAAKKKAAPKKKPWSPWG